MIPHSPAKHSVFPAIMTGLAALAALLPTPPWLGIPVALLFLAAIGAAWGRALLPDEHPVWRTYFGSLAAVAALVIVGGAVYYVHALDPLSTALTIAGVGALTLPVSLLPARGRSVFHRMAEAVSEAVHPSRTSPWWAMAVSLAFAALTVWLVWLSAGVLRDAATDASIRSPWDAAPQLFFVTILIAAAGATVTPWIAKDSPAALLAFAAFAALATSVTTFAYSIGFGFDPFIHQATELAIMAHGAVEPKPLYYLGHYALTIISARASGLPVQALDAWMVPGSLALMLPCGYWALRRAFGVSASAAAFAAGTVFTLIPLSPFIPSTPQGSANVWFLATAFVALPALTERRFPNRLLLVFAAASAMIHPLAGIPSLILAAFVLVTTLFTRRFGESGIGRAALMALLVLFGSLALPIAFIVQSMLSGGGVTYDLEMLREPWRILQAIAPPAREERQYIAALDIAYGWRSARTAAFVAAAAVGIVLARRHARGAIVFAAAALTLFINHVLLKAVIDFPFLISYERGAYADRIADLALFTLAAPAAAALAFGAERLWKATPPARIAVPLLAAVAMTSSVYLAYPRRDKVENSRGWSTSASDVAAVQAIEQDAGGRPYVVLANQATSAAAVRTFGFRNYYGSVFFYPIPTGGPLYEIFLEMNETGGARATAKKAMDLAGVDTAYFAVSYYWWDARRITSDAREAADKSWTIGEDVYLFKYARK